MLGCNLGAELGEIAREVARVMAEHKGWLATGRCRSFRVGNKPANRAADIVEIHCRGSNAWMLGPPVGPADALLGFCDHSADGASTQTTGAKGEGFVKTIVELAPMTIGRQLADHSRGKIRG